jgi:hypothetical protein
MLSIASKKSSLNPDVLEGKYKPQKVRNSKSKFNEMRKIDIENEGLLKRLQSAKSTYGRDTWTKDLKKHEALKMSISRICSNTVRDLR